MGKVTVVTVGCKVNQAESEELKMDLVEAGHSLCADPAESDICVVNTCTVTAESDRKCRKLIRGLHRKGARAVMAAGCYVQVKPDGLNRLPGVIEVIPNSHKAGWLQQITDFLSPASQETAPLQLQRTRGFIKVQDGCERGCSYCIVPRARGVERSRPLQEIMHQAKRYLRLGTEELVLCGINLGRYVGTGGLDLAALISEVISLGEGFRIRLSSIELEDLNPSWLEEWSVEGRICPHLHLPLQSGDAAVLKDMGRGYGPQDFIDAAETLQSIWPQATLTTEVIVGYPGENEEAFEATLGVLEAVKPSRLHVFRFSPRPGTRACEKGSPVPAEVAVERSHILRTMGERWRGEYVRSRLGETCQFLVEKLIDGEGKTAAVGTTGDYIKATMDYPPREARPGRLLPGKLCLIQGGRACLEPVEEAMG